MSKPTYEELEVRVRLLTAENVSIKRIPATDSVAMLLALDVFKDYSRPDVAMQMAFKSLMYHRETPATNAEIAELRAEGVEMFAKTMHADSSESDALEFALQLRESIGEVQS